MNDEDYMKMAVELAKKGIGSVNPNPLVGAVIVKEDRIIGQGWHERYGGLHAERNALECCIENPKGATMYVTLEPCCHHGRTPPCTEAILQRGIKKVVIGCLDPNPLMAGKSAELLKMLGVQVIVGCLEQICEKLNDVFFHYIKEKMPFVVMKYAMTMDGKIATTSGKSKWITGEDARANVHKSRNRYMAIMTGVGTVLKDNPALTCRIDNGRNPVRIICDTRLRTPIDASVVATAGEVPTIIATASNESAKIESYQKLGCKVIRLPETEGHIDLQVLMKVLGEMGIDSILLEGGSTLNFSALKSGIVHKVQTYISPKIFGGEAAKTSVGGTGIEEVSNCIRLKNMTVEYYGEDILLESEVKYSCLPES